MDGYGSPSQCSVEDNPPTSIDEFHQRHMRVALLMVFSHSNHRVYGDHADNCLSQAEEALAINEVPVGCVFVCDGQIIGRGRNDTNCSLNVSRLYQGDLTIQKPCVRTHVDDTQGNQACRVYGHEFYTEPLPIIHIFQI